MTIQLWNHEDLCTEQKQIFIAFDKQDVYPDNTKEVLLKNKVLQISDNGCEFYGQSWNKEKNIMKMSYNKLWKLLIDKNMKKSNLRKNEYQFFLTCEVR